MSRERRSPRRATLGRRSSERTALYKKVKWQDESGDGERNGMLIGISETGLALLTDSEDTPNLGALVRLKTGKRRWNRRVQVIRVDLVSAGSNLVAAEFADRAVSRPWIEGPRRSSMNRGSKKTERRSSPREWRSQPIWWAESADCQLRQGWLIERSADGAAFLFRGAGSPLPGTPIRTSTTDPRRADEPMREALVRRVEPVHADLVLMATSFKPAD